MARGSIIKRENKDGSTTYYIKYRDLTGKQIKKAIGPRFVAHLWGIETLVELTDEYGDIKEFAIPKDGNGERRRRW